MVKLSKNGKILLFAAVVLILIASVFREISKIAPGRMIFGVIRSAVYILVFSVWGYLLSKRIIRPQLKRFMTEIAACLSLWFIFRTLKYQFLTLEKTPTANRYCWYAFYIPIILLPLLSLFATFSIGKPESYKIPGIIRLLNLPAVILIALVFTNDFHQKVFYFPDGVSSYDNGVSYEYGVVYWIILAYVVILGVSAFVMIFIKCRIPGSGKFLVLPLIPAAVVVVYSVLFHAANSFIINIAGDMTAVYCVWTALLFECLIQCGLIQSNTHYTELFMASDISALITDDDLNICYASENSESIDSQTMTSALHEPVISSGGIRLRSAKIGGGYIFWQEDISDLLLVLKVLKETSEELESYGGLLEEENKKKRRSTALEERKRLYELIQDTVRPHIEPLRRISDELKKSDNLEESKHMLGRIAVIGAYIKRRTNLIILADRQGKVNSSELELCLMESINYIKVYGAAAALNYSITGDLSSYFAGEIFDFFEFAAEISLDSLSGMAVFASGDENNAEIRIELACSEDMTEIKKYFGSSKVINDDGVWYLTLDLPEKGESA